MNDKSEIQKKIDEKSKTLTAHQVNFFKVSDNFFDCFSLSESVEKWIVNLNLKGSRNITRVSFNSSRAAFFDQSSEAIQSVNNVNLSVYLWCTNPKQIKNIALLNVPFPGFWQVLLWLLCGFRSFPQCSNAANFHSKAKQQHNPLNSAHFTTSAI